MREVYTWLAVREAYSWLFVYLLTASRLGLYSSGCSALSGDQVDEMDMTDLEQVIPRVSVFYRVSPRHKHKIVKVSMHIFRPFHFVIFVSWVLVLEHLMLTGWAEVKV